jgi:predicted ArsR family transcriptional regulator
MTTTHRIHSFLHAYGAASVEDIARELQMDAATVRTAINELAADLLIQQKATDKTLWKPLTDIQRLQMQQERQGTQPTLL